MQRKHTKNFKRTVKDFYQTLVACNFDGASVISEKGQCVIRRQQPGCVYLWCIAHRLELVVWHAVNHDDYVSEFEDIIDIFLMYYLTLKLQEEVKVLSEQLDDKITKEIGGLK